MNAAKENLPAPNTRGLAVSNKYDITGKEEPQKKTVEKTAKMGVIFFITFLIDQRSNYKGRITFLKHCILIEVFLQIHFQHCFL